jgi:hypothetical protein
MGADNKTPYLARSLQQQGFTGVTGSTPYKSVSPEGVQALQSLYYQPPLQNVKPVITNHAEVININLDGTQNNGSFPAPGESPTNVFQLAQQHIRAFGEENTIYRPGVGAPQGAPGAAKPDVPASNWDSMNHNAAPIANAIVLDAYDRLSRRVTEIRQQDPNAEISINLCGFSRGAAQAVALANLIQERGIPGLYEAGQTRIDSMLLYDPVDMTNGALNTAWPSNVQNNLVMVAMGESRHIMPSMQLGAGANVVGVAEAAHANVGGSFNERGIEAVTLGAGLRFQQAAGMAVSDAPADLQPDWGQMYAHDSSLDNFGNVRWSTHDGNRCFEGADRLDPSVQDVINNGAVPPFGKPALVQPPDTSLPQGVFSVEQLSDGSSLYHYENGAHVTSNATTGEYNMHVPLDDGQGYLVYSRIRNDDGSYSLQQFELNAQGELLGQQSGSQSSLQREITWDEPTGTVPRVVGFDTHLPDIGEVPTPGDPIASIASAERAAPVQETLTPAVQGAPLTVVSQNLLESSMRHVRQVAEQHGLPWSKGLENTAYAIAASARAQGMSDINLFRVADGQIRYGQLDGAMLKDGVLDARQVANQPMAESLQRLAQLDQPQQQENQAYAPEPMARAM